MMEYWQSINDYCFSIPKNKITEMFAEAQQKNSEIKTVYFSTETTTQKSLLSLDNWELTVYPDKDEVTDLAFDGPSTHESAESDEAVMALIAKYNTEEGAFVWMDGEGHDQWKWFFVDGKVIMVWPEIYWPDPGAKS